MTKSGGLGYDASAGRGWAGWKTTGPARGKLVGVPAVVVNGAGQTEVVAATSIGTIEVGWQPSSGNWRWLSGPDGKIRNSPTAVRWAGGAVAVLDRLSDGKLGYAFSRADTGSASWTGFKAIGGRVLGSPTAWLNTNHVPQAAVLDTRLKLAVSSYSAPSWTSLAEQAGGF